MNESSTLDELIIRRRSIMPQHYTGKPVDDYIIKKILENANWAPTHKLTEPWRFIVYSGKGLERLAQEQAGVYRAVTQKDGTFKEERYQNLLTKPMQSSHIIVIGMKRDERKSIPEIEEIGAVFCAIQNMYLTATAYGVGCYLSTGGITYFENAKSVFGLEKDDKLIGFFNVGSIDSKNTLKGKRNPVEEKTQWIIVE